MFNTNEPFKPLLSIGILYIQELLPDISPKLLSYLESILDLFISRKISQFDASNAFMHSIGITAPLDKIIKILSVTQAPLLTIEEYPTEVKGFLLSKKTRPWTEIEDTRLLAGIHKHGLEAWGSIAAFVGNSRTKAQCNQRWSRGLDPRLVKMHWTQQEDQKLLWCVDTYGTKCWTKVATEMGSRSDVQCRYRYKQITEETQNYYNTPLILNQIPNQNLSTLIGFNNFNNPSNSKIEKTPIPSISTLFNSKIPII